MNLTAKRSFLSCLPLALIISTTSSCKKNSDAGFDPNGTKLAKVTIINSPQAGTFTYSIEFLYDNQNRVIEIAQSGGDSVKSKKYFYNTNEQQPFKCVDNTINPSRETYYFYDNNGKVITDSMVMANSNDYTLYKYNWFSDKVFIMTIYKTPFGLAMSNDSCAINNNNITAEFTLTYPLGQGMSGYNYKYDNKINPLNTLNIRAISSTSGIGGLQAPGYSKNNITEMRFGSYPLFGPPGFRETSKITYNYKYNNAGLPVECEEKGTLVTAITKYYYTK